jgi:hypothetical protein
VPSSDYRPSVGDIGARMFARTLDKDGKRVGTFNADTLPTATAVDTLIDDALATVESAAGANLDGEYLAAARVCVIWHTAMLIELSYFPESTEAGDSAYKAFKDRYTDTLGHLKEALTLSRPGDKRVVSLEMRSAVRGPGSRLDPFANYLFP